MVSSRRVWHKSSKLGPHLRLYQGNQKGLLHAIVPLLHDVRKSTVDLFHNLVRNSPKHQTSTALANFVLQRQGSMNFNPFLPDHVPFLLI